jgi:hypothetical protein
LGLPAVPESSNPDVPPLAPLASAASPDLNSGVQLPTPKQASARMTKEQQLDIG